MDRDEHTESPYRSRVQEEPPGVTSRLAGTMPENASARIVWPPG